MAQNTGPAEPILTIPRTMTRLYDRYNQDPKKPDTSWHDEKVRQANQSFQPKSVVRKLVKPAPQRAPARPAAKRR